MIEQDQLPTIKRAACIALICTREGLLRRRGAAMLEQFLVVLGNLDDSPGIPVLLPDIGSVRALLEAKRPLRYKFHLGEHEDEQALRAQLPAPFPQDNFKVSVADAHRETRSLIDRLKGANK